MTERGTPTGDANTLAGLAWAVEGSFEAFGVRCAFRTTDAALAAELEGLLPPGSRTTSELTIGHVFSVAIEGTAEASTYNAYMEDELFARSPDREPVMDAVRAKIRLTVAEHSPDRIFIHAGVVTVEDAAILIPGRSFSGKSTLVRALLDRGAVYYSDEYAVLDEDGMVHPYPAPISLRREGVDADAVRGREVDPAMLGATVGDSPAPVGLIASLTYRAGAERWAPRKRSTSEAALRLMENAVAARTAPERCLRATRAAAEGALFLSGSRGEADDAAARLIDELTERRQS